MRYPCLWLAFAFTAGILCPPSWSASGATIAAALSLAGGLCSLLLGALQRRANRGACLWVLVSCAFFGFASSRLDLEQGKTIRAWVAAIDSERVYRLRVTVLQAPRRTPYSQQALVRVLSESESPLPVGTRLRVWLPADGNWEEWVPRRRFTIQVRLRRRAAYRNPGSREMDRSLQIPVVAVCKSQFLIEEEPTGRTPLQGAVEHLRNRIRTRISARRDLSDTAKGLVLALLIGDPSLVPEPVRSSLAESGVAHVFTVSGLHVAMLFWIAGAVGRCLHGTPGKVAAVQLVVAAGYCALCGGRPPVLRAVVFATLWVMGRRLGRSSPGGNVLGVTALGFLAVQPTLLWSASFRLSFLAVAGIVFLYPGVHGWLQARLTLAKSARTMLAASVSAQAALAPELLRLFGCMNPAGILLNLFAVPAAALLMVLSPVMLLGDGSGTGWIAAVCNGLSGTLVRLAGAASTVAWWIPPPSATVAVAYGAGLLGWCGCKSTKLRKLFASAWIVAMLSLVWPLGRAPSVEKGHLRLTALDVGQGDAILVEAGEAAVLVDTGGRPGAQSQRIGSDVLIPALHRLRRYRLSAMILTHGDMDHRGGALELLERIEIDRVYLPAGGDASPWLEIEQACLRRGIPLQRLDRGKEFRTGPMLWKSLWPPEDSLGSSNNRSLVLSVGHSGSPANAILTGDLEAEGEEALVAIGLEPHVLLKVGHHGSKSSTTEEFLRVLSPRGALISAGVKNRWGHPSEEIVRRLSEHHVSMARTDLEGAVAFEVDAGGRIHKVLYGTWVAGRWRASPVEDWREGAW